MPHQNKKHFTSCLPSLFPNCIFLSVKRESPLLSAILTMACFLKTQGLLVRIPFVKGLVAINLTVQSFHFAAEKKPVIGHWCPFCQGFGNNQPDCTTFPFCQGKVTVNWFSFCQGFSNNQPYCTKLPFYQGKHFSWKKNSSANGFPFAKGLYIPFVKEWWAFAFWQGITVQNCFFLSKNASENLLSKWFMTHVSLSCRKLHHIAPWNFELFTDGSSMTIFIRAWRRGCVWISQVGSTFSKECIKGNTCISPAASMPWLVDTVSYLPKFCTNSLCWLKVWYRTPESTKGLGRWRAPPLPVAIPFVKAVLSFWQGYSFWQGCSFWQGPSFWQGCSFWQGPSFWQGCSNPFVKDAEARYCFSKLEQKATIHKQL